MINSDDNFRPWGQIEKILSTKSDENWALISCVSMEDRCKALYEKFAELGTFSNKLIFRIDDPPSISTQRIDQLTDENIVRIRQFDIDNSDIMRMDLTAPFGQYDQALRVFLNASNNENLIVDITTMPKKIFFFLIRLLRKENFGFQNIIVTYTEPSKYGKGALAGNPDPWDALPGFRVSRRNNAERKIVIGIGYEPLGLPELINSPVFDESLISFLFPFPGEPDRIARNWRFIRRIFPNTESNRLVIKRVDGINVPEVFDTLSGLGMNGEVRLILAPYGPKPISLAMALYAAKYADGENQTGVYYTQPSYYSPDYSSGIRLRNGTPVINAYCIRLNGNEVY